MDITQKIQKVTSVLNDLEANCGSVIENDNQGQVIVYTGLYIQSDGSVSDTPDPNFED